MVGKLKQKESISRRCMGKCCLKEIIELILYYKFLLIQKLGFQRVNKQRKKVLKRIKNQIKEMIN